MRIIGSREKLPQKGSWADAGCFVQDKVSEQIDDASAVLDKKDKQADAGFFVQDKESEER